MRWARWSLGRAGLVVLLAAAALVLTAAPAYADYGDYTSVPVGAAAESYDTSLTQFAMELGPDGAFWLPFDDTASLLRVALDGTAATYPLDLPPLTDANDVVVGADGNLWFSYGGDGWWEHPAGGIGRLVPGTGEVTLFDDPTDNLRSSLGVTLGEDGRVWAASTYGSVLVGVDTSGDFRYINVPQRPFDVMSGPDGDLWWTGRCPVFWSCRDGVPGGRTDLTTGETEPFPDSGDVLTQGPDGNVWTSGLYRLTPDGERTHPAPFEPCGGGAPFFARDDNLWRPSTSSRPPCRAGLDGTLRTIDLPEADGREGGVGPDGDVWFLALDRPEVRLEHIVVEPSAPLFGPTPEATPAANEITLDWEAPGRDGGSITAYRIYRDGVFLVEVDGHQEHHTDAGLVDRTSYEYEVAAVNDLGESPRGEPVSAEPSGPPTAPLDLSAVSGVDQVVLAWSPPADLHGYPVDTYRIYRDDALVDEVAGHREATTVAGGTNGTSNDFEVSAVNQRGEGPRSDVAAAIPRSFSDVFTSHPFFDDVEWMAAEGISTGTQPGPRYLPSTDVTRQAMSAFLYRLAGQPEPDPPPAEPTFPDVPTTHPFHQEIEWMADADISTGYPDGTYRPADDVTRQAMSAFLFRLSGDDPLDPLPAEPTFTDVVGGHPFLAEIEWMAATGISTGHPDGTYRPGVDVTRQAMAAFLHRLADGPGIVP